MLLAFLFARNADASITVLRELQRTRTKFPVKIGREQEGRADGRTALSYNICPFNGRPALIMPPLQALSVLPHYVSVRIANIEHDKRPRGGTITVIRRDKAWRARNSRLLQRARNCNFVVAEIARRRVHRRELFARTRKRAFPSIPFGDRPRK